MYYLPSPGLHSKTEFAWSLSPTMTLSAVLIFSRSVFFVPERLPSSDSCRLPVFPCLALFFQPFLSNLFCCPFLNRLLVNSILSSIFCLIFVLFVIFISFFFLSSLFPFFSSHRYSPSQLKTESLGRSHRSKVGKARLKYAIEESKRILGVPDDYLLGIVSTGILLLIFQR